MSEYSLAPELVESIKTFVDVLKSHPGILDNPDIGFFREYLISMGAKIPSTPSSHSSPTKEPKAPTGSGDSSSEKPKAEPKVEDVEAEEPEEPYPELDNEGVIEADELDPNQDMGNPDEAASEEEMDKSNELKIEAVGQYNEGNFEDCVAKYTEAIKLNGGSAILFAKRGQAYLQLQKPKACIRDCNRALQINPDSAVAFKFRGRAHRLLGHWEEAAADLRQACKIDFDEQADTWLKEVTPNARKLEEYRLRKKRRDDEREIKLRKRRAEERARAHEEAKNAHPFSFGGDEEGESGGMPGMGDFPGAKIPGLDKLMSDPEVVELFSDPDVAAAFNDIGQNPMNILKYQSNPKVSKLLGILQKKMGGMGGGGMGGGMPFGGGMPGGMPGGFGGFGGMPGFGSAGAGPTPPDSASQGGAEDLD